MTRIYSDKAYAVKPVKLSDQTLLSIGRIVRAFAEIDDLLMFHIAGMVGISESQAIVLLGRSQASAKMEIAQYLAKMKGENFIALHKEIFNSAYDECRQCRNTVAHGVLLGETEEGKIAFLTAEKKEPDGPSSSLVVISYPPKDIDTLARISETFIGAISEKLQLASWRDKRLQQSILPHPKAQTQPSRKTKPPRQPKSSRGK
jgi:hypothetical protein